MSALEHLEDVDRRTIIHPFSALNSAAKRERVILESADGITLTDIDGKRYLDAGAGLWNANIGYGRREVIDAATAQMEKSSFLHSFGNFTNAPLIRLSERLISLAPDGMQRVVYCNSGSEANDTQVKLVRRYNNVRGRAQKKKIIARRGGYHGTGLGSGSLTGLPVVHRTFDLPQAGFLHTHAAEYHRRPANIGSEEAFSRHLAEELDRLIQREGPETVAAFIAEPIAGSAGVLVPPKGYFRAVRQVLRKHDVLMIADEVITGFGRTGSWFASAQDGIEPDLITIGKGLTSGYFPMSGCLVSGAIAEVLASESESDGFFGHGFTTSGHPVGAAVALANIDVLARDGLLQNSESVGRYLREQVESEFGLHELVGEIRGRGLMIGIEFDADKQARRPFSDANRVGSLLSRACLGEGLIVRGGHGRVVAALAPPLVLTRSQADEIVERLKRGLRTFETSLAAEDRAP